MADYFAHHGDLAPRYGEDCFVHGKLPEFWKALHGSPACVSLIVEDNAGPTPRIAASRLFVAVKDSFADEMLQGSVKTPIAEQMVRRWLDGEQTWLSPVELRLANRGHGIRLLTVHIWEAVPKEIPRLYCDVCASQTAGMNQYLKGAKIVELIEDACDEYLSEVNDSIGYWPRVKFEDGSWIGSITKADAERNWALYVAESFHYRPPRIFFSETQKEILGHALEGFTDEEIAERLSLSVSAVKKRWSGIYDHVASKGVVAGVPAVEGKRGPERRRMLMDYLRWHPEELNPIALH